MNKINAEEVADGGIEEMFRERVADALSLMEIPPFTEDSLDLARTETEIAKCKLIIEGAQKKKIQGNKSRPRGPKKDMGKRKDGSALRKQKRSSFQRKK